ncbi:hypothetical protein KY346_05685 [Candidatus Woesearchaeota archaeon]|nr:hypothetical protein [Candidatus Woesearchaeota archaeon]
MIKLPNTEFRRLYWESLLDCIQVVGEPEEAIVVELEKKPLEDNLETNLVLNEDNTLETVPHYALDSFYLKITSGKTEFHPSYMLDGEREYNDDTARFTYSQEIFAGLKQEISSRLSDLLQAAKELNSKLYLDSSEVTEEFIDRFMNSEDGLCYIKEKILD